MEPPLAALLSQTLVAFTLELDNEFERRMIEAAFAGIGLSLMVWSNLFRFVTEEGVAVRELPASALVAEQEIRGMLGCLERWGFISLEPPSGLVVSIRPHRRSGGVVRDGFGSGRGIGQTWLARPTGKGRAARAIWPSLFDAIEGRWRTRFGADVVGNLRTSLHTIVDRLDVALPDAVPLGDPTHVPRTATHADDEPPLPTLLSKTLLAFALDFNRASRAPLALCANVLRVVTKDGVRVSDLARLTGGSPEVSAIGWRLKPYVIVESAAAGRGRIARVTPSGLEIQRAYPLVLREVEQSWDDRFGNDAVQRLLASLSTLFRLREGRVLLSEGLVAPPGVRRSADRDPAVGIPGDPPAERKRTREMTAQTAAFVANPAGTLPHFPMWDMNRGLGP